MVVMGEISDKHVYLCNLYNELITDYGNSIDLSFVGFIGGFDSNYSYALNVYQGNRITGNLEAAARHTVETYYRTFRIDEKTGKVIIPAFGEYIKQQLTTINDFLNTNGNSLGK